MKLVAGRLPRGMSKGRLGEFIHQSKMSDPSVIDIIAQMELELDGETLINQIRETSERKSLIKQLFKLQCPVLIVNGEHDQKICKNDQLKVINLK